MSDDRIAGTVAAPQSRRKAAMTYSRLLLGSLAFHWRSHFGVVLGAAVGSAVLIGALAVGDSVRESLRRRALLRIGAVAMVLDSGDRLFGADLVQRLHPELAGGQAVTNRSTAGLARSLHLSGTAARADGAARALKVDIYGASYGFWSLSPREERRLERLRTASGSGRGDPLALMQDSLDWLGPAAGHVRVNPALAEQLNVREGDTIVLRFPKPSALSRDAVISPRNDATVALRVVVDEIVAPEDFGEISLHASARPALNAFVNLAEFERVAGVPDRANLLLVGGVSGVANPGAGKPFPEQVREAWEHRWQLNDAELQVRTVELPGAAEGPFVEVVSRRIFLDPAVGRAALRPRTTLLTQHAGYAGDGPAELAQAAFVTNGVPLLTYLVNELRSGDRAAPYSMVTAAGPPWTPADLRDDEIVVGDWLAQDLGLKPGSVVQLAYFDPEAGAQLRERTNRFTVRAVVPLQGVHADRTLMPEFPGLAKAESTHDWDAGFPLVHRIRDTDEQYWKQNRGTPKAFVSLAVGRRMWGNRFGDATAIRYRVPEGWSATNVVALVEANLLANLRPAELGLAFRDVREAALRGASSGQDFGGLFIGFSFFLVVAALLLMALLFQFGLERRLPEIGTLLAIGFRPGIVRWLWLGEGAVLAYGGAILGVVGGVAYARAMIHGLVTLWRAAVAEAPLGFHVTSTSIGGGLVAGLIVAWGTIALALRRQFRRPARELLAGEGTAPSQRAAGRTRWVAVGATAAALALVGWAVGTGAKAKAEVFFGAGSLLLIGALAAAAVLLARWGGGTGPAAETRDPSTPWLSTWGLALRGTARRRSRSLATMALLASGTFLIASLGAFRLDAQRDAADRASGTGGFALVGESALPVTQDLNRPAGLEFYGLSTNELPGVSVVPFRVRDGDDASCLNLNRAQRPRILGVNPAGLASRAAFSFAGQLADPAGGRGWEALRFTAIDSLAPDASLALPPEIPAIGDMASIQWALGRKLGDTLELTDERGRVFRLRLVAGVANSVLQGNLIIDEAAFTRLFPGESGYRWFLVDAPGPRVTEVSAALSRALGDVGLELTPAATLLARFNAVQNTYLSTFQVLGGFGLLLGSAGLGVVVLRNVLERRGELALLMAVGFTRTRLARLVFLEHVLVLALGLGIGVGAAALAVLPSLLAPTVEVPFRSLGWTLAGVVVIGLGTAAAAVWTSLRGPLLTALRGE